MMPTTATPRHSEYRLRRRVHFYEADPAGIVHFSWFSRYLEEAEHALWREAGLSIAPLTSDIAFPRVAMTFDFRRPLRFEDEFEVHIRIAAIGRASMRYTCVVTHGGQEVATGSLTIACVQRGVDGTMHAVPIPDHIRSRFEVAAEASA